MTPLASCFTTTFHAIAGHSKLEYTDWQWKRREPVSKTDTGYASSEIVIRPNLTILNEGQRERAIQSLHKAKVLCLVSRALATAQKLETRAPSSASVHSSRMIAGYMSNDILGLGSFVNHTEGSLPEANADCGAEVAEGWSEVWFGRLFRP